MKIKHFFILMFLSFIALSPCAADKSGKTDKYDDPGSTTLFEKIIEFENETADSLYDKCLIWCKKNFKFQNECYIDYADKQSHTIRATYVDIVRYTWPDFTSGISGLKYDFRLDTKNGRVRMRLRLQQGRFVNPYGGYSWLIVGPINEKKGNSEDLFKDFIYSLSDEINNGDDEDW